VACLLPVVVFFALHLLMAPVPPPLLHYLNLSAASTTNDSAIFNFLSYHFVHHIHPIFCQQPVLPFWCHHQFPFASCHG
jgi:hypothetical protein